MRKRKGPARQSEFLEPITSALKTKKFCVYDIESKSGPSETIAGFDRPFLVGFFDPETLDYHEFRDEPHLKKRDWRLRHISPGGCIDKFLTKILVKEFAGRVWYAHNGGNFDHLFLLAWLQNHRDEFQFEVIPVQSSIQVLRVWKKPERPDNWTPDDPEPPVTETWDFLDSLKLVNMSLSKACDAFNVPNKVDHDLHRHEDDPSWTVYLKQDCHSLAAVMACLTSLIECRLGGEVGITAASSSMKLFRRKYMGHNGTPDKIARHRHWPECKEKGTAKVPGKCHGCAHDWIRRGYYGGRTEIFRLYGTRLHYFDINSSYVAAMKRHMPIGTRVIEHGKLDWRKHYAEESHPRGSGPNGKYSGFCECTVYIPPECPVPPLPHKDRATGKLCFPTGRFHGVWSVEELALLDDPLVNGYVEYITATVWFRLEPMFGPMMEELWKLRDQSLPGFDKGLSELAKLLGNSTYGKFAMKQERTTVVFAYPEDEVPKDRCFLCKEVVTNFSSLCNACEGSKEAMEDGDVWYQAKRVDAPYIIPHVASHITALARVRLWFFMRLAVRTPGFERTAGEMQPGDTFFRGSGEIHGSPELVLSSRVSGDQVHMVLRNLDTDAELDFVCRRALVVRGGGRIFYLDTDSCVCDVMLPQSSKLGDMKDEYPDEELNYLAVQPKVYIIETIKHNARIAEAKMLVAKLFSSCEAEAASLSPAEADVVKQRLVDGQAMLAKAKAQLKMSPKPPKKDIITQRMIDPIVLTPIEKVTMKGFPSKMKTKENLQRLRGAPIDWNALTTPEIGKGETLSWGQLEKVRSLARTGFRRPPMMREGDTAVTKSFQSPYDKRIVLAGGGGNTRAVVLDEPVGGYKVDQYENDAAE